MSGKLYIGSPNGIVKRGTGVYVGDSNGVGHIAKGVFVGDQNGKARKIWPASILPRAYQQVEWINVISNSDATDRDREDAYMLDDAIEIETSKAFPKCPRVVIDFSIISTSQDPSLSARLICLDPPYFYAYWSFRVRYNIFRGSIPYQRDDSWSYDIFESKSSEHILPNTSYRVDFNNTLSSSTTANFYLYNSDGYYSVPSNNLVYSKNNYNQPDLDFNHGTPYAFNRLYLCGGSKSMYSTNSVIRYFHAYCYKHGNNELANDLYPCYRKADGANGFYDMVNKIFYPYTSSKVIITRGPEV